MAILTSYKLFLDDIREPYDAYEDTKNLGYIAVKWVVVRSYDEFVAYIQENGRPSYVSFDHDLAPSHYTEARTHSAKTGYDCALWLIEYCKMHKRSLPVYSCHSQNPVGKDKILELLSLHK